MKTLYLDAQSLKAFMEGSSLTVGGKVYKKGLILSSRRPLHPKGKIITIRVPDTIPLQKGVGFQVTIQDNLVLRLKSLGKNPILEGVLEKPAQVLPKPITMNDHLFDAMVRHQITLLQYGQTFANTLKQTLDQSEPIIKNRILSRLDGWDGVNTAADAKKLDTALDFILSDREKAWDQVKEQFQTGLEDVSKQEAQSFYNILDTVLPYALSFGIPALQAIYAFWTASLMQGQILTIWIQNIQMEDERRIRNAITLGGMTGETPSQIAERIIGSPSLQTTPPPTSNPSSTSNPNAQSPVTSNPPPTASNPTNTQPAVQQSPSSKAIQSPSHQEPVKISPDGVTQQTRNAIDMIAITSVNFVGNLVRQGIMEESDLFDKVVFTAVLDSRTTLLCASLDGNIYALGKAPLPPLHPHCRSKLIPYLEAKTLKRFALKANTEKKYVNLYATEQGITGDYSRRADLPRDQRAGYDDWFSGKISSDIGKPVTDLTYEQFLKRQPLYFQEYVLGKTKAKLFRDGGLGLDKFVNGAGGSTTLESLVKTQRQSFIDAGLDPDLY